MHNTATLTLTTQFLDRAHALDAAQWQRIAQRAHRIHIGRILERVLADWSLEDRIRAVGPQRRLFARHLGRWAARILPTARGTAQAADRVFGPGPTDGGGAIDTAVLAALTAIDQPRLLSADAAQALYAPFAEVIPLDSLLATPPAPAPIGLATALAEFSEERSPAFGLGPVQARRQRRNLAVRRALAEAAATEAASSRLPGAVLAAGARRPAWLSDLASYRPGVRSAAAWTSLAAGLALVGFAIFGFRGDAVGSIAPVSGAVVSPAVLNPLTPTGAVPASPGSSTSGNVTAGSAIAEGVAPSLGESPVTSGALPSPERIGRVPQAPAASAPPAGASIVPDVGSPSIGAAPDTHVHAPERISRVPVVPTLPPALLDASLCADGACWLAMGAVYEADQDWARAAAAYTAAADLDAAGFAAADDASAEARVRAALLRALHPADTAALPGLIAMDWLGDALAAARTGDDVAQSPLLLQAALDTLFAESSDNLVTAEAYQVVNAVPVGPGAGQLVPVGQLTVGDRFLPVGRCNDPNGRWTAVWFARAGDGNAVRGWVNLDLAGSNMRPLLGSDQANGALQARLPVLAAPCAL